MKTRFIILLVFFFYNTAFAQKSKLAIFKESKIKIIGFDIDNDPNKLPILTFTIQNSTKENIIFNRILLNLYYIKKYPLSSSSNNALESKELTPIAGVDLNIPILQDTYMYTVKFPIEITKKDAATIQIRLFCNIGEKHIVPSQYGRFKFNLAFITSDNKAIVSKEIILGY